MRTVINYNEIDSLIAPGRRLRTSRKRNLHLARRKEKKMRKYLTNFVDKTTAEEEVSKEACRVDEKEIAKFSEQQWKKEKTSTMKQQKAA